MYFVLFLSAMNKLNEACSNQIVILCMFRTNVIFIPIDWFDG